MSSLSQEAKNFCEEAENASKKFLEAKKLVKDADRDAKKIQTDYLQYKEELD